MLQVQTKMKRISMHNKRKMLQIQKRKKLKLKHLRLRKKNKLPQKKKNKQPLQLRKNMQLNQLEITNMELNITAELVSSTMVMMNIKVLDCKKFHKLGKVTDKRIAMSNSKNKNKQQ